MPPRSGPYKWLGMWVRTQRFYRDTMPVDRRERLESYEWWSWGSRRDPKRRRVATDPRRARTSRRGAHRDSGYARAMGNCAAHAASHDVCGSPGEARVARLVGMGHHTRRCVASEIRRVRTALRRARRGDELVLGLRPAEETQDYACRPRRAAREPPVLEMGRAAGQASTLKCGLYTYSPMRPKDKKAALGSPCGSRHRSAM